MSAIPKHLRGAARLVLAGLLGAALAAPGVVRAEEPGGAAPPPSPAERGDGEEGGEGEDGRNGEEEGEEEAAGAGEGAAGAAAADPAGAAASGAQGMPSPAEAAPGGEAEPAPEQAVFDESFFDEAPAEPDPEAERFRRRVEIGRAMRERHQGFAIATWGTMLAAEVVGTINAVQRSQGDGEVDFAGIAAHRALVATTTGLYLTTGMLVWAAPPGLRPTASSKAGKVDSSKVHRALSIAHGIGMATQLATGFLLGNVAGGDAYDALLVAHMASGYATFGLMTAAGLVIIFN